MEPVNIEFILNSEIAKDIEKVEMTIKRTGSTSATAYKVMLDASDEAFRSMSASTQTQIKAMQGLIIEMRNNEDAQEALKTKFSEGQMSASAYAKAMSRLSLYYAEQKASLAGMQSQITKEIESNRLIEGSYNQKVAKLKELREAYKDLSEEELNNQEVGHAMIDQIKKLEAETEKFEETLKGVQKAMGNTSSITGMKESLDKMEKQYASLSAEQRKNKDVGGAQAKAIRSLKGDIADAEAQNRTFIESLKDAPGALGSTVTGIEETTKAAMKFIATPLGAIIAAIVVGLTLLSQWFKRTGEGEQALANITGMFSQVLSGVLNVAAKLGSWLYKVFTDPKTAVRELGTLLHDQIVNRFMAVGKMATAVIDIFKNLFDAEKRKAAVKELGNAYLELLTGVENVGQKIAQSLDTIKKQGELKKQLNQLAREEIDLKIESERAESRIQKLLTKATDISSSSKERNAAVKEGLALIDATTAKEVALAKRKMELTRESYRLEYGSLNNLPLEAKRTLADLEIQYVEATTKLEEKKRAFTEKSNNLARESASANKKTEIEKFEEALGKKKEAYQRFYALMAATDKSYAKIVYADLTANGDSYLKYVNTQIDELQKKRKTGTLTGPENDQLALLYAEKMSMTGTDSPVDVLKREMESKKKLYGEDLVAYKAYLQEKKNALAKDESEGGYAQKTVVTAELADVDGQQQKNLDDLLEKYKTGMSKLTSLQKDYNKDMLALDTARAKAQKEGNTKEVQRINDAWQGRKEAYESALSQLQAEDSGFYEVLFGNLESFSSTALSKAISEAKTFIEKLKKANGGAYASLSADQQKLLNELLKGITKAEKTLQDKIPATLRDASNALRNLSELAGVFDDELGQVLATSADVADGAADIATGIASFAVNPVAAIASVISGVTKIVKIFAEAKQSAIDAKNEIADWQFEQKTAEMDINLMYRERLRTAKQIGETTLEYNERITKELKKQQETSQKEYNDTYKKLQEQSYVSGKHIEKSGGIGYDIFGIWKGTMAQKSNVVNEYTSLVGKSYEDIEKLYNSGTLDEKAKALFEQLEKLKQEGVDVNEMLVEQAQAMREAYTGTTSDAITQSIIQGFEDGYSNAADFAANFESMMRKAVLNSISMQYLEPEIEAWYNAFAGYAKDGTLSSHIDELRKWMASIVDTGSEMYQGAMDALGLSTDTTKATADKSGIQSITEATGNKVEGHLSAVRLNTAKIVASLISLNDLMAQQLTLTQKIVDNTSNLSKLDVLQAIEDVMRRIENDGIKLKN